LAVTGGTADVIEKAGVPCRRISKLDEGRPNIRDMVTNGECKLIFNTPTARGPATDEGKIRALATIHNIPLVTTMTGAEAVTRALEALRHDSEGKDSTSDAWTVRPLQEYFPKEKQ
jgi:carbamoyl-phosphate synthase large subunit